MEINIIKWNPVKVFNEPDENGYVTYDNPSEEGKDYLVRRKNGTYGVYTLWESGDGMFFDDLDWEDVDAWAELPEKAEEVPVVATENDLQTIADNRGKFIDWMMEKYPDIVKEYNGF